jgi:uncharacterized protein YjiS (DUF1127 family)
MFGSTNTLPINPGRSLRDHLKSYLAVVQRRSLEKRSIKHLQNLDDRMLCDIGVTPGEALRAKPRPFQQIVLW